MERKGVLILPGMLLCEIWPSDRVVIGLRVSKSIRTALLSCGDVELRTRTDADSMEVSEQDVLESLWQLGNFKKIRMSVCAGTRPALERSWIRAVRERTPNFSLVELDMSACALGLRDGCQTFLHIGKTGRIAVQQPKIVVAGLSRVLGECPELKILRLSSNCLQEADTSTLWPAIATLTNLHELALDHNHIHGRAADSLTETLTNLTKLTALNLKWCCPYRADATRVIRGLRACTNLESLHIGGCMWPAQLLTDALRKHARLRELDCSFARSGPWSQFRALPRPAERDAMAAFLGSLSGLTLLDLRDWRWDSRGTEQLASGLLDSGCDGLIYVDLSSNALSSIAAAKLGELFARRGVLQRLFLGSGGFFGWKGLDTRSQGGEVLGRALQTCSDLQALDLTGAANVRAEWVQAVVASCLSLRSLRLDHAGVTASAFASLCSLQAAFSHIAISLEEPAPPGQYQRPWGPYLAEYPRFGYPEGAAAAVVDA